MPLAASLLASARSLKYRLHSITVSSIKVKADNSAAAPPPPKANQSISLAIAMAARAGPGVGTARRGNIMRAILVCTLLRGVIAQCDENEMKRYEDAAATLIPAVSLDPRFCNATATSPSLTLRKELAWLVYTNSRSMPLMNLTLDTYARFARNLEPTLSLYACVEKPVVQWPAWVGPLYYNPQHEMWMPKALECVAQLRHAYVVFMMDDWFLTGPPNYDWFDYAARLMNEQSAVNWIGFSTRVEFGGITTPWTGLVFSPTALLEPALWRTSSLLASLHATASLNLSGNPRMAIPAMYESPGMFSNKEHLTNALDVTYGKSRWGLNLGTAEVRPWHWPGLRPVEFSVGAAALSYVHAVGGGKWRSSSQLCTLFDAFGAWESLGLRRNFHPADDVVISKNNTCIFGESKLIQCDYKSYCQEKAKRNKGPLLKMPMSRWYCPNLDVHDAIRLFHAEREARKAPFHIVDNRIPLQCKPHWTGMPGSIRTFVPREVKQLGGSLQSVVAQLKGPFARLGVAPPCCFNVHSYWRMEKIDNFVVCAPLLGIPLAGGLELNKSESE